MNKIKKIQLVIVSGILLILAFIFHLTDLALWKNTALIMATIIAGYTTAYTAFQTTKMKTFSIELLVTIAVIGALIIGEYVEAAAVTFLFLFGAYLEARTIEKTRTSLKTLMDMAPLEATVIRNGKQIVLPVEDVKEGDHIAIQSGEKVAVDGKVISGTAFINEAAITGESVPAMKREGDAVFSGTIVDHGYMEVIAEKVGDDTAFAKIIELVEEAQEGKARTQKFLEKFAAVYTPGIIVLSILVFVISQNIELALTFLVIACPGALVISAPVSLVSGIGNGARNGALLKGGEVMENLAKIDVIVFDKTGTLTEGTPSITNINAIAGNEKELLKLTAEVEQISEHHLGQTIVKEAKEKGIMLTNQPKNVHVEKGHGLIATIDGHVVVVGNRKLLKKYRIDIDQSFDQYATDEEKNGNTAIFIGKGGKLIGIISIADQVRQEAISMINELKKLGIQKTVMLTGDNRHTAEKVAKQLGIDIVHAEMLPEDKVSHIEKLKKEGYRVAMVGDGINDAPAIALADVGIAMGVAGTDAAMETADVVLMADNLSKVPYAYDLAKATVRNMKQNMYFAVGTVGLLLVGVLFGKVFLASGMLIHEISVLLVVLNALRLVKFKEKRNIKSQKPTSEPPPPITNTI